jgi:hypothetical protein
VLYSVFHLSFRWIEIESKRFQQKKKKHNIDTRKQKVKANEENKRFFISKTILISTDSIEIIGVNDFKLVIFFIHFKRNSST